jgi:hypothetical protein
MNHMSKSFLKIIMFSVIQIILFQGSNTLTFSQSHNSDGSYNFEIVTKKDKALRVLSAGTVVTSVGVSCVILSAYWVGITPSEIAPVLPIKIGAAGMGISVTGNIVSIIGIVKFLKECRRKKVV